MFRLTKNADLLNIHIFDLSYLYDHERKKNLQHNSFIVIQKLGEQRESGKKIIENSVASISQTIHLHQNFHWEKFSKPGVLNCMPL